MKHFTFALRIRTTPGIAVVVLWLVQPLLHADGYHGVAERTKNIDEWLQQVLRDVHAPGLADQLGGTELRAGKPEDLKKKAEDKSSGSGKMKMPAGKLQAELSPQQQQMLGRKAGECLEILAFLEPQNVLKREFPDFQMSQIPGYRAAAKKLLGLMGPQGGAAVATQLRSELMGTPNLSQRDIAVSNNYYKDLLDVLRTSGTNGVLSENDIKDLRVAASGRKSGPQDALAKEVVKVLDEIEDADAKTLLKWLALSNDRARKDRLTKKLKEKLSKSSIAELLDVLQTKPDRSVQAIVDNEFKRRLLEGTILDLLNILDGQTDATLQKAADEQLARREPPKYGDIKDQIPEFVKLLHSKNAVAAKRAQEQLENAFARASIPECLRWLEQEAEDLKKIIWGQLDERIKRAEPERREEYRTRAVDALKDKDVSVASKLAAIELLSRLQDRQVVGELIDNMLLLPRESWPKLGELLRKLTGQNFGPKRDDGVGEVKVARKKWQEWWGENQGK
ncbi:MAG: hypothetical protein HY000_00895 [Planctomycetes bacterium]|nr:hypothetical protein [Planctomycetota bacterium]